MNTDNTVKQHASLFDLDGVPKMSQAIPLALHSACSSHDCRLCDAGHYYFRRSRH